MDDVDQPLRKRLFCALHGLQLVPFGVDFQDMDLLYPISADEVVYGNYVDNIRSRFSFVYSFYYLAV